MKRMTTNALLLLGLMSPGLALAHGHGKAEIKLFKESAAALESTNPDLAERLKQCAAGEHKKEGVDTEEAEKKEAELFRDAAKALKADRPDLAKRLNRAADKETREAGAERHSRPKTETPPTGY